jgi:hypothetical protein
MKVKIKEKPRCFKVGNRGVEIQDHGKIYAEPEEMLSWVSSEGKEYDIVAKGWGYYATPSINGRLLNEGYKTALVKNSFGQYFIMLVDENKMDDFREYLTKEANEVVEWLDERPLKD